MATTDRGITDGIIVRTSTRATIITGTGIMAVIAVADIMAAGITADTDADHQRGGFSPLAFSRQA